MGNDKIFNTLPDILIPWYQRNNRDLPWRADRQPYHIWLSEIMLQQTRVEAVKGYYQRFLDALPTIASLAEADDGLIHKLWEGLGYYSRVRNLKRAAQMIINEYGGVFPGEYNAVLSLPGIGEYTAGAICSIAFDQPTPAVDGNVLRVIARLTDDDTPVDQPTFKKKVQKQLAAIYPAQAGDFTQALMELGATVCGPNKRPDCSICPLKRICLACTRGTATALPVRLPKRSRQHEEKTVFIIRCDDKYALEKRPESGLLAGLWQFPNVHGILDVDSALAMVRGMGLRTTEVLRQVCRKHIFTHIQWDMCGIYLEVAEQAGRFSWLTASEINTSAALPTAFRQFWDEQ